MKNKAAIIESLMSFYQSIEPTADEQCISSKKWRRVMIGKELYPAFYDDVLLGRAIDLLMQDTKIDDNYQRGAVENLVADNLIANVVKIKDTPQNAIDRVILRLQDFIPESMRVCMPVYGITIPSMTQMIVGSYTFYSADGFSLFGMKSTVGPLVVNAQEQWGDLPHVSVVVTAMDPNKAKEKALCEFQWLENAVRLFLDENLYDFGITNYDFSRVQNVLVTTTSGDMRGVSSELKGSRFGLPISKYFGNNVFLRKVVEILGIPLQNLSKYHRRIRQAVSLGGLSAHESDVSISYFLAVAALEALFATETDKYVSASIAQQIVESYCYLIAAPECRRGAFEQMRTFYGNRSAVAHGDSRNITVEECKLVRYYLRCAITKLLTEPNLLSITDPNEISSTVKDLKFGKTNNDVHGRG